MAMDLKQQKEKLKALYVKEVQQIRPANLHSIELQPSLWQGLGVCRSAIWDIHL